MTTPPTDAYLAQWGLTVDGDTRETPSSVVVYVRRGETPAVLKVHKPGSDERQGYELLRYFDGAGAARVIEADDAALLMERACGERSLVGLAVEGRDAEASHVLADVIAQLHRPRSTAIPASLTPLNSWFDSLFHRAGESPLLARCAEAARSLLEDPQDVGPLHGDIHHDNVLDGGARGWLAIDPKGLLGERCYEVANLFGNPLAAESLVLREERMLALARIFAARLGYDPGRTLRFAFAHAGLSASWDIENGNDPRFRLRCAELIECVAL